MIADDLPAAFDRFPASWREALPAWTPDVQARLVDEIRQISGKRPIAPEDPFRALRLVAPSQVKVVVFGQDPYPTAGHADGLAFSAGSKRPPSLRRIHEVLAQDRPGWEAPPHGRLDEWARQGVLLLNPTLTVEIGRAGSHVHSSWRSLTSEIVRVLLQRSEPPAFLLWGGQAAAFFRDASAGVKSNAPVWSTRHPSYDFQRRFMADGSHFVATADRVDWWALA